MSKIDEMRGISDRIKQIDEQIRGYESKINDIIMQYPQHTEHDDAHRQRRVGERGRAHMGRAP